MWHRCLCLLVAFGLSGLAVTAYGSETNVFTANSTIQATNDLYENTCLLISNCTVTVEGSHIFDAVDVASSGILDADGTNTLSALTVNGSTFRMAGGGLLSVADSLMLTNASTLLVRSANITGQVEGVWAGMGGTVSVSGDVFVASDSFISANGEGYRCALAYNQAGCGPGGGAAGGTTGGGGAGYGGAGGAGQGGAGGPYYGDGFYPTDLGSGGGAGDEGSFTGHGGGAIRLIVADTLQLDGAITANGANGSPNDVGGGAGGSIWATVGALEGNGVFQAVGGNGTTYAGAGAGGRVAVYYQQGDDFNGYTNSSVQSGANRTGDAGTLLFVNMVSGGVLRVTQNYVIPSNTVLGFEAVSVENGATLTIGGGTMITVTGLFQVVSNSTVVFKSVDFTGMVNGVWAGTGVTVHAGSVYVQAGSRLSADGQGYRAATTDNEVGKGPGGGLGGGVTGGGGAGYGGSGGAGQGGAGGALYGSSVAPAALGSGGGRGDSGTGTGHGGGQIRLIVDDTLQLDGSITANGANGSMDDAGGGSGGSIWITADTLTGNGTLAANGGNGTTYAGAGSGGRMAVYYRLSTFTGYTNASAVSGANRSGQAGSQGFFDTSLGAGRYSLFVPSMRFDYPSNSTPTFDMILAGLADAVSTAVVEVGECGVVTSRIVTLTQGAQWVVGGASTVVVTEAMSLSDSNTAVWCGGKDTAAQVNSNWVGSGVAFYVSNLTVGVGSRITADAQGYRCALGYNQVGCGPGGGVAGGVTGGGGAGHGEAGGSGQGGSGGVRYDSAILPMELGSGGGAGDVGSFTGHGGGAIQIYASGTVTLDGTVSACGANGSWDDIGGGAGGSILAVVKQLAGTGYFKVNGGNGTTYAGAGAGGRVAVYYQFGGLTNIALSTADSGINRIGGTGTVGFFQVNDRSNFLIDPARTLHIAHAFRYETEGDSVLLSNVLIGCSSSNALLSLAGGLELKASGTVLVENASTVLCLGRYVTNKVNGLWVGQGVTITAGTMRVDSGSVLHADAQGYRCALGYNQAGSGPGGGRQGGVTGGSGGGYGGSGGDGAGGVGGSSYGSNTQPTEPGSGGGAGDNGSFTGHGGGVIKLTVGTTLFNDGRISADGANGSWDDIGGGAGGSLWITSHRLEGVGCFQANGGNGTTYAGAGAGGRVAVYYSEQNFTGFTNSFAASGSSRSGEAGTIGFFEQTGGNPGLNVYHNYTLTTDTQVAYASLTLHTGATFRSEGGVVISVDGDMQLATGAVFTARGKNTSNQLFNVWAGSGVALYASNLTVDAGARITADAQGYRSALGYNLVGNGPGGGAAGGVTGAGGAGYGGAGGDGYGGSGGSAYGSRTIPTDLGSGGGAGDNGSFTGHGGGAVTVVLKGNLTVDGELSADGANGSMDDVGGGSGGSLLISAGDVSGDGILTARGGNGTTYAGAGSGGRVAIYHWGTYGLESGQIDVSGGTGKSNGSTGTLYVTTNVTYTLQQVSGGTLLHDSVQLRWTALGINPASLHAVLRANMNGLSTVLAEGDGSDNTVTWNTRISADGVYDLILSLYDSSTQWVGQANVSALVNNSVAWHGGGVSTNEVWSNNVVHVIESNLILSTGVTVMVQSGAVVKVASGVSITISNAAVFNIEGTNGYTTVLTSLADDTAGGDSNLDGDKTVPHPGDWSGIVQAGTGQFVYNDYSEIRYSKTTHSGTVSSDETWLGTFTHIITSDLTIPSGVTVTVDPGAVVKVYTQRQVVVQGTLRIHGTMAMPVYVTSIRDDTVGGDSNGDGDESAPAAGDWLALYANGGTVEVVHGRILYGGGSLSESWNASGTLKSDGAASLILSNSIIRSSFYDGVLCWGGTARIDSTLFEEIGRAVCAHPGGNVYVYNCTFFSNSIGLLVHGGSLDARNNAVTHNIEAGLDYDFGTLSYFAYNDVWSPTNYGSVNYRDIADQTDSNGNISADPKYRNTTNANFRLNYGSPCIDAADTTNAPVTDALGIPRVNDPRTAVKHGVADTNGIFADMGAFEFTDTAVSDVDLIPYMITAPASGQPGDTVTISWTVRNRGSAQVSGSWHDKIMLSPDEPSGWDAVQTLAEVTSSGVLGPNQSTNFSTQVTLPGGVGSWHVQVLVNARGEMYEGANWNNNQGAAGSSTILSIPVLAVGDSTQSVFSSVSGSRWFAVSQSASQDVSLVLSAAASQGVSRIYAGYGRVPDTTYYDARSTSSTYVATLGATAPSAAGRILYVLLASTGYSAADTGFVFSASQSSFALTGIGCSSAGNAGWATIPFSGRALDSLVTAALRPASGGSDRAAASNLLVNSGSLFARFNLTGVPAGTYHAVLKRQGITRMLSNAFSVVSGQGGHLYTRIIIPPRTRQGRTFSGYVEYGNDGDADIPAPLLSIEGYNSPNVTVWPVDGTNNGNTGFTFVGKAFGSPYPDVLAPGSSYQYEFKSQSIGSEWVDYRVSYVNGDDSDIMNYVLLEEDIRPASPHALWTSAWARVVSECGVTRGEYIAALNAAIARAAAFGLELTTEQDVLEFMVRESFIPVMNPAVFGRVVLGDAASPISRADVVLIPENASATNYYTSASWYDGTFGIRNVPAGAYRLTVPGYLPTNAAQVTVTNALVSMDAGTIILTSPLSRLSGSITIGTSGQVITNAVLSLAPYIGEVLAAVSDESGSYAFTSIPAGEYVLSAYASDWLPIAAQTLTFTGGEQRVLNLAMTDVGGVISGLVMNTSGDPVSNADVTAVFQDNSGVYGDYGLLTQTTDGQGSYAFRALPSGNYQLTASYTNAADSGTSNAVIVSESTVVALNLSLQDGMTITGRVVSALDGSPLSNAVVTVAVYPRTQVAVYTDDDGWFQMNRLTPGVLQFSATAAGYLSRAVTETLSATNNPLVTIELCGDTLVDGYVQDNGSALPGVAVSMVSTDNDWMAVTNTDESGYYLFSDMFPGNYSVMIGDGGAGGASLARTDISLSASNTQRTVSFLGDVYSVTGRVWAANGTTPVSNATIYVTRADTLIGWTTVNTSGEYAVHCWSTGEVVLSVSGVDTTYAPRSLTVTGLSMQADFTAPTGVLEVVLTSLETTEPITNASLELASTDEPSKTALIRWMSGASNGVYRFEGVADGNYALGLTADGFAFRRYEMTFTAASAPLELALESGRTVEGTVTTNGTAAYGASVYLCNEEGRMLISTRSDTNGAYRFTTSPTGTLSMVTVLDGYTPVLNTNVNMSTQFSRTINIDLSTASTATLSGVVADDHGAPAVGVVVYLKVLDVPVAQALSGNNGEFSLTGWPTFAATLSAQVAGGARGTLAVSLTSGVSVAGADLTVPAPCLALYDGTDAVVNGSRASRGRTFGEEVQSILHDILSGEMGIPDPLFYHTNLGYPENMWNDYRDNVTTPYYLAPESAQSCAAVQLNRNEAWKWAREVDNSLDAWRERWRGLSKVNAAQVGEYLSKSAILALKGPLILNSINGLNSPPSGSEIADAWGAVLPLFQGMAEAAGNIQNLITEGKFGTVSGQDSLGDWITGLGTLADSLNAFAIGQIADYNGFMQTLENQYLAAVANGQPGVAKTVKGIFDTLVGHMHDTDMVNKFTKVAKCGQVLGPIMNLLGFIKDANQLVNDINNFPDAVRAAGDDYLAKADMYYKALKRYQNALANFRASLNDCTTGTGGTPNTPPSPQPNNTGDHTNTHQPPPKDPNDKLTVGYGDEGWIRGSDRIYYTIRFENVATAAAPAGVVYVTDVLSEKLDWTTVELGEIGFNNTIVSVPTGLQAYAASGITIPTDSNITVSVDAVFSNANGSLSWTISAIDPITGELPEDPLVGFLPPNVTNECGEGYVSFSVMPKTNLSSGATITNTAKIIFDVNDPIWTPQVTNRTDRQVPVTTATRLHQRVPRQFPVSWSGQDSGGSGVSSYEVYVSVNGGAFSLWKTTNGTHAVYSGYPRTNYAFRIQATDAVGNRESKTSADTHATVGVPLKNDFDGDGCSDIGCYYAPGGIWYLYMSHTGFWSTVFGYADTEPITGDFDGDDLCDYGVYHAPNGQWNVQRSSAGPWSNNFGYAGTVPVTGDFDGDGLCDFGCYYAASGAWYIFKSRDGFWSTSFGYEGTVPVTGDFDGDGIGDFGCYYPPSGAWYIFKSRDGFWSTTFGYEGTLPITGDFDGDAICDFGCYYPPSGAWYVYRSRDGFWANNFGYEGTLPITGDYDGDVIDDFGCYYPPYGAWYIYKSRDGFWVNNFGYEHTVPLK